MSVPGLARRATVADIMNGAEQELESETGSGGTLIRKMLIKDYPVFVRLTS
jgi:hypothetical protein